MDNRRLILYLAVLWLLISGCQIKNESITIQASDLSTADTEADTVWIEPEGYSWLNFEETVINKWQVDPLRVESDALGAETVHFSPSSGGIEHTVVALFSKESSAYEVALNEILRYFDDKRAGVEVIAIQLNKDEGLLSPAISWGESQNTDLFLSFGSDATSWLHDQYQDGSVPVVSVTSKDPVLLGQIADYETGSGTHFAFTSLNIPIEIQLNYLQQFRPELKQIGILYAKDNTSAVETQVLPLVDVASVAGIESILIEVEDRDNVQVELTEKMQTATAQMLANDPNGENSLLWITGSTSVFNEIETINQYAAGLPVLSVVPNVTQAGEASALLSIGIRFETNAQLAGRYALDVLNGANPGDMPVGIVSPPDIAINFLVARENQFEIPFSFFESATFIYDGSGQSVRTVGP